MTYPSQFQLVHDECDDTQLVIRDSGDHAKQLTVTNDAERVVKYLRGGGLLPDGRRLFYYDSDGQRDEILVKDGEFAGFA